jgi:hypothetical protein
MKAAIHPTQDTAIAGPATGKFTRRLYFLLTVMGFSFWFFMAAPFASHRESYWWLGMVQSEPFARAFSFISKTYRPLAQGTSWLGFMVLDPNTFNCSISTEFSMCR